MADVDELVAKAQKQLEEHREWLALEIRKIDPWVRLIVEQDELAGLAREINLRVVKAFNRTVTVVYDYPDKLYAFLCSDAPEHLRATLAGGHVVDPNQPASSMKRVRGEE